jgi:transposase
MGVSKKGGDSDTEGMNSEPVQVYRVERVDDIPVLLATLNKLKVAEILDRHYPSGHRWKGELTFGEVTCVWLAFLTSQGDHRLCRLQPWAEANLHTLSACLGKAVRSLDFQDDRLADILDRLALDHKAGQPLWQECEFELNQHTVRVYHLRADFFRVDTTTANTYAKVQDELGYIQFGHSKDRDDLPQIKIPLATLDPLGMPVSTFVVAGNCADDPLYVPEVKKVQQAFPQPGKTFVMDCKGMSLDTRAYLAQGGDHYLGPLTENHVSAEQRRALLQPVWQGTQTLQQVYRPAEGGPSEELVAQGFCFDVVLTAQVDGQAVNWTERRWLVQSQAYAQAQQQQLDRRLHKAKQQLAGLGQRKQGKKRLTAAALAEAAERVVKENRVEGLLTCQVKTATHSRRIRAYGDRPARLHKEREHHLEVSECPQQIEQAKRAMGWRVYATNQVRLSLAAVVWGYRGQNSLEGNYSRLKGQPLGLTPLYLQYERRIVGLVLLLSLALRLLSVLEWSLQKKLQESGQPIKGLYPGQPGRKTKSPSAELLLEAFKGISLTVLLVAGQLVSYLTPLSALQQRLLELWDLPADLYLRLTLHFSEPPPI